MNMKYKLFEVIDEQGHHFARECLSERSCKAAFDKAHKKSKARSVKPCDPGRFNELQLAERVMKGR